MSTISQFLSSHQVSLSSKFIPSYNTKTMLTHWIAMLTRVKFGYTNQQNFDIEQNISTLNSFHHGGELTNSQLVQQMDTRKLAINYGLAIVKFNNNGCHQTRRLNDPKPEHILKELLIKENSIYSGSFEAWAIAHKYRINDPAANADYQNHINTAIRFHSLFTPREIKEIKAILVNSYPQDINKALA